MPIDPNIILGLKPTQDIDIGGILKNAAQMRSEKMQQAAAQQQLEAGALDLQQKRQVIADDQTAREIFKQSGNDHLKAINMLMASGNYKVANDYAEKYAKRQTAQYETQLKQLDVGKQTIDAIARTAGAVRAAGYTPEAINAGISNLVQSGAIPPEKGQQYAQMAQTDPVGFQRTLQQFESSAQTETERLNNAGQQIKNNAAQLQFDIDSILKPQTIAKGAAESNKAVIDADVAAATKGDVIAQASASRKKAEQEAIGSEIVGPTGMTKAQLATLKEQQRAHDMTVEGVTLTPEARSKMAETFAVTGVLPNLGMGRAAAAQRSAIINEAAKNFPNVDFATNRAAFQANQSSLRNLQKTLDFVESFEKTASKNIDIFLNSAKGIIDTGSPLLNTPARLISDRVMGSEKMAAFNAARETALTEAAKVLESPGGSATVTVSGREAIKTLSSKDATLGQQIAAMKVLKQDMENRKQSGYEQVKAIQDRIKGATGETPAEKIFTEADIAATVKASGKTRDEVIKAIKEKGYVIR